MLTVRLTKMAQTWHFLHCSILRCFYFTRVWIFFHVCFFFSCLWIVNEASSRVRESERERVGEGKHWVWTGVHVYLSKRGWPQTISNKKLLLAHPTCWSLRMLIFHLCIAGPLALRLLLLVMCQSFCMLLICFLITFISRCESGKM